MCPLPNPKPVPANRPNMEAKRPPKPLIITSLCKLNTKSCLNQVTVSWVPRKEDTPYSLSIYLVEKLTPDDLLRKLKSRGQRDPAVTRSVISSKLEDKDDEISTSSVKVTMACPLSMMRMSWPARASTCDHLQCFDADMYIKMNEKKPKWVCPVCNKPAYFEDLFLDGFYIQLLLSPKFKALTTNEIILNNDASWDAVEEVTLGVSDSDDDEYAAPRPAPAASSASKNGVTTIDDDEISVIPIMTDADGAPILGHNPAPAPTHIPVNNLIGNGSNIPSIINNRSLLNKNGQQQQQVQKKPEKFLDDDVFVKKNYAQDVDYCDWNYSVKFFQFLRDPPPPRKSPSPPPSPPADSVSEISDSSTKTQDSFVSRNNRGRGRGRGRGKANLRQQVVEDEDDDIPTKTVTVRGRGRGRGRGAARGKVSAARTNKRKKVESSEEEEDTEESESEEEVVTRPTTTRTSARAARHAKRVNYAAIEESFEVLDHLH